MQVLGPLQRRCGLSIAMVVVIGLASRIKDLLYNESYELFQHNPYSLSTS